MGNRKNRRSKLVVRVGTDADKPGINALCKCSNTNAHSSVATSPPIASGNEATLVMQLPSGELAASLLMRMVRIDRDVDRNLGVSIPFESKDQWVLLSTSHSCSLDNRPYLDVLHFYVLHFAQFNKCPVDWQLSVHEHPDNRVLLEGLGYQIHHINGPSGSLVAAALPSKSFFPAYSALHAGLKRGEILDFAFEGASPFRRRAKAAK